MWECGSCGSCGSWPWECCGVVCCGVVSGSISYHDPNHLSPWMCLVCCVVLCCVMLCCVQAGFCCTIVRDARRSVVRHVDRHDRAPPDQQCALVHSICLDTVADEVLPPLVSPGQDMGTIKVWEKQLKPLAGVPRCCSWCSWCSCSCAIRLVI